MHMAGRESLHQLVDSLPDAALDVVERALRRFQTWPPEFHGEAQKMHQRMSELIAERTVASGGAGKIGSSSCVGFIGARTSTMTLTTGGGSIARASGFDDGADVHLELRKFHGHEVHITRQVSVSEDKRKLLYKVLVKGPDGKEARREMEFDVPDVPPSTVSTK
jgi:hypothetical protein